jgi:uncharacterized protein (TIGR02271 family)
MSGSYVNTDGRSDSLNDTAAHDTGLYDPALHDNQIVAIYDTDEHAQSARHALVAAGVPNTAIRLVSGGAATTTEDRTDEGFWGSIKSLFVPDDDRSAYSHAMQHGHAMVVVTPDSTTDRTKVIHVLEATNPIDFDAKLEEWRQSGYDYSTPSGSAGSGVAAESALGAVGTVPATSSFDSETGSTGTASAPMAAPVATPAANTRPIGATTNPATTGTGPGTGTVSDTAARSGNDESIQVLEERLRVGKREVAAGAVRVRSYVVERPVEEQVRLHEERITLDRRPVDRVATSADVGAFQERTIEAHATAEEAVVSKTAHVVEEIGIHKEASDRTETVRDSVRHTEVEVEDTTAGHGTLATGGDVTNATPGATSSGTNAPRK